jgi:preprotein translocase subunit SecG
MPMNWTSLREYYGLKRPFNFGVAIPFLLNVFTLIVVFCICIFLFLTHGLSIGTSRFYFYGYLACFLLVAAAISKIRRYSSYILLCWCVIELGLAFGSKALYPKNNIRKASADNFAFVYHPLLQLMPRPGFEYKYHLDFRGVEEKAKAGGVPVASLQGQELTLSHNSLGLRGKELTGDDLKKDLIFVYGGSTTYDVSVTQGETWVEHLQSALNNKYTVLNFGVVAHSTEEHLIETAFYQNIVGKKPACAIYYVGWNDVINAHLDKLDSGYADYHLLLTPRRKPDLDIARFSPLMVLLNQAARDRFDTIPKHANILGTPPQTGSDPRLESIFVQNIKTIAAINEARGTKPIFIGQMINKDWAQGPDVWAPLVKKGDFPNLINRFNALMKEAADSAHAKYIDAGVTNFQHGDFVDYAHFTSTGAGKFASLISKEVDASCH